MKAIVMVQLGQSNRAVPGQKSSYGEKYEVRGTLLVPSGRRADIVTIWIHSRWRLVPAFGDRIPGSIAVSYKELDTVILNRDLPDQGLRRGDLGAVVQVYGSEGLEVEFVTASGRTQALATLNVADVRAVSDQDLLSVRTLARGAA